jgi:hypothetical protein
MTQRCAARAAHSCGPLLWDAVICRDCAAIMAIVCKCYRVIADSPTLRVLAPSGKLGLPLMAAVCSASQKSEQHEACCSCSQQRRRAGRLRHDAGLVPEVQSPERARMHFGARLRLGVTRQLTLKSAASVLDLAERWVHLSLMALQAHRTLPLIFVLLTLPAAALAKPPERAVDERQAQMADQLRKARELDRQREARREERVRESRAAKTTRAMKPAQEAPEEQRARLLRDAAARREVRAADRLRTSNREAARRARAR